MIYTMGGSSMDDDWEFAASSDDIRTVVLVGRTGNGKSATGNSILGRKAFKSRASSASVTTTCELQSTVTSDGQIVNVIDTPGLFDFSVESEYAGKEIVKCIDMAKDGIHAVLVVFSVRTRFTQEEEAALRSLQTLFGSKIVDYMIMVFTGGDDLEDNDETLEDYLGSACPKPLKEILALCENRCVLFDNKTKDEHKKFVQVQQLLSLVNMVVSQNSGRPYTDELFKELQEGEKKLRNQKREVDSWEGCSEGEISEFKIQMQQTYDDQLKRITEMVESKLKEATARLEERLAEEQAERHKADEDAKLAQERSDEEIRKLREHLEKAEEELRNRNRAIPENVEKVLRAIPEHLEAAGRAIPGHLEAAGRAIPVHLEAAGRAIPVHLEMAGKAIQLQVGMAHEGLRKKIGGGADNRCCIL